MKKFVPIGDYCYKILKVLERGKRLRVKYCDYRDYVQNGVAYCHKTKLCIEDDCKHCGLEMDDDEDNYK